MFRSPVVYILITTKMRMEDNVSHLSLKQNLICTNLLVNIIKIENIIENIILLTQHKLTEAYKWSFTQI